MNHLLTKITTRRLETNRSRVSTVYPKKYAHGFVVLCFVVVMQSFIMNSHEVFIHIHQGCFAGTGAIVRLPQCQWSKPDGYGKISQCITTTKHSKAKTVCLFLGIYCIYNIQFLRLHKHSLGGVIINQIWHSHIPFVQRLIFSLRQKAIHGIIHKIDIEFRFCQLTHRDPVTHIYSYKLVGHWSRYSISQEICTRFCCALLCCGYAIVHDEFTWSIYPYSSGLLCWHWGNR